MKAYEYQKIASVGRVLQQSPVSVANEIRNRKRQGNRNKIQQDEIEMLQPTPNISFVHGTLSRSIVTDTTLSAISYI